MKQSHALERVDYCPGESRGGRINGILRRTAEILMDADIKQIRQKRAHQEAYGRVYWPHINGDCSLCGAHNE